VSTGEGTGSAGAPSPYFGAAVIAMGLLVLVVGVFYLNKSDEPPRLIVPAADGVTPPTDSDGRTVDIPPSQPAGMISFAADGSVLRPDPVRARVVDRETGVEILITLPRNTVVDAITGAIIPRPPGTSGPTTVTTGPTTTPSSGPGTTRPTTTPTTAPTTTTTDPPATTTTTLPEETTTTTVPEETTTTTVPEETTTTLPPDSIP
jgi:eukaryotic-like serine/threonine-protein kinase